MASASYTDSNRPIQLTTPLGPNTLLAANLRGQEAISELFRFQIDTLTPATDPVKFESSSGRR